VARRCVPFPRGPLLAGLTLLGVVAGARPEPAAAQAPVSVQAELSAPTIGVGESVVLNIVIRTQGAGPSAISLPQLSGGLVAVGSRQSEQVQLSIPGGRTRVIRREIHLNARRAGRYAIPPVVVTVDGRRYRSQPLVLEVVPGAGPPLAAALGGELSAGPGGEALLRSTLEPDTVWVGQQVTLRSDALFTDDVRARLRRSPEFLPPELAGAWSYDLPDVSGARTEWIGSARYEVHSFRRAFFPIDAGTLTVPSAQLLYEVRRGFLFTPETERLETPPLRLSVRPLPDSGVPDGFTGAVGYLGVEARLSPDSVAVGDAAVLRVRVSGQGNIKALPAPRLPQGPWRFESGSESADFSVADGRVEGTKTFEWVVVPERAGELEIGSIRYPFFDPATGEYLLRETEPLRLRVTGAPVARTGEIDDRARLRPLRATPGSTLPMPSPPLFAGLLAAPFALIGLVGGGVLLARRPRRPGRRAARRRLRSRLRALRDDASIEPRAFAEGLRAAAQDWLAERFDDPGLARARNAALADALREHGVTDALAGSLADLLARVERIPYRPEPVGAAERTTLVERVEEALSRIDRLAPRGRGRGAAAASSLALLLLAAPLAAQSALADGARLLDAGRRAEAVAALEGYVRANPADAAGWYDLGTALATAGQPGRATHALLRALELAPRDDDAAHNLRVLGVEQQWIAAARSWPPLDEAESRWLIVALTWTLALCVGVALWRRRSRGWWAAAALVAVLLAGLGTAQALQTGRQVGVLLEGAPLREAPTLRADARLGLEEAQPVRITGRRDGWLRVRTGGGLDGWVEEKAVGIV